MWWVYIISIISGSTKIIFVTNLNRSMSLSLLSIKFYFLFCCEVKVKLIGYPETNIFFFHKSET